MKKILVVVVALASMNAFATRARVNALGNAPHLIDTQTVYSNPADMMILGDFVTLESGITGAGAQNANAEVWLLALWAIQSGTFFRSPICKFFCMEFACIVWFSW